MLDGLTTDFEVVTKVDEVGRLRLDAAKVLERDGWCQNNVSDSTGAVCLMGAIFKAQTGTTDPSCADWLQWHRATEQMGFNSTKNAIEWNNAPERTKEEVIARLRSAAVGRG